MASNLQFKVGDKVVYPSHGVGEIIDLESGSIAGIAVQVYVISFPHDKMVLRVPVKRAAAAGLRALAGKDDVLHIIVTGPHGGCMQLSGSWVETPAFRASVADQAKRHGWTHGEGSCASAGFPDMYKHSEGSYKHGKL